MRRIRIAQIGTSRYSHGSEIFGSLKKQSALFDIAGYTLPQGERELCPERTAVFDGYRELSLQEILENPSIEAVTIETEEPYLTGYAQLAAEHGKHIHMEKPGGTDLAEFERLIATVKAQGTVFHTGYMYRYNPVIQQLLAQVRQGEFGQILRVEAQMDCHHTKEMRQWLEKFPGGMLFFLGCHLLDLVLQIQGVPQAVLPLSYSTGLDGLHSRDVGMALLQYPTGLSLIHTSAVDVGGYAMRRLVITGTKATAAVQPLEMLTPGGMYTDWCIYRNAADWSNRGEQHRSAEFDRYDGMMAAFAGYIAGDTANPYSPDYELQLYRLLQRCCRKGGEEK